MMALLCASPTGRDHRVAIGGKGWCQGFDAASGVSMEQVESGASVLWEASKRSWKGHHDDRRLAFERGGFPVLCDALDNAVR